MRNPSKKDLTALDWERLGEGVGLQSSKISELLNIIDRVRANGVGDHVALPQLVVCGEQSAGKSSVLEGISGIPFRRQGGLCTRFPTEIILHNEPGVQRATATIIPHISRTDDEKTRLSAFHRQLGDFTVLPNIIGDAARLMGVRGHGTEPDAPAFSADVLHLELVGNTGVHLTTIDLPGLIYVSENGRDVQLVRDLVDSYLENSQTIILAVVPASRDVDAEVIIQRARHYDKAGLRTVGIITKPDLINAGTESGVARLVKNRNSTRLNLGFFVVKNPSPAQLEKGITHSERRKSELEFFSTGPWKGQSIDPSRVGIDNLRVFLQELLDTHVEGELRRLQEDVRLLLNKTNEELVDLGMERSSPSQIRVYLTRISSDFHTLVKAGVEGDYGGRHAAFFRVDGNDMSVRLRAAVHMENEKFATYMTDSETAEAEEDQLLFTDEAMTSWIRPSEQWGSIARSHVDDVVSLVSRFICAVLAFVVKDPRVRHSLNQAIVVSLNFRARDAYEELDKLLEDEARHPITYNHYYTDNIQKARLDRLKRHVKDSVEDAIDEGLNGGLYFTNTSDEVGRLVSSVQARVIVDTTGQACVDARTDVAAYYKVAMKTFVDNVCRQVIERHILAKLPSAFDPIRRHRAEALQLQAALEQSLRDLAI